MVYLYVNLRRNAGCPDRCVMVFHTGTKLENPGFDQPVTAFSFLSISVFTTSKIMEHAPDV